MKQDKDIAYCICTEGSDLVFPYLRVMLLSLFKHNSWVKGDLVILTCDITPLSTHNREILESIVPNIKYVDIDSKQYNSFSVQNSNRAELLTNLYRINAFSLHGFDFVMYISSLSFCISSIAKLFVGNSDILVANSGTTAISREPGVSARSITEFNSSVMIISKEVSDAKLKDAMLARLKNTRRITGSDISNAIQDVIKLNGNNISYQNVDCIVKKSKYNDSKFSQFKAIQSNVAFIELDIGINEKKKNTASFRYKEMNRLWHSYNIQGEWNSEETPSGIVNINAYVERVKERKVAPPVIVKHDTRISIPVINTSQAADYIQNKRICLVANSSDLSYSELGEFIDSHDVVVRFNGYKIDKKHTGIKTNIHASIYLSNSRLNEYVDYRLIIANTRIKWKNSIRKGVVTDNQIAILDTSWPVHMNNRNKREFFNVIPTTGLNTIIFLKTIGGFAELNIIGFNFYDTGSSSVYRDNDKDRRIAKIHNYKFEKKWVHDRFNETKKYVLTYDNSPV